MYTVASPRTDDSAIEQEIKAKGLTAHCVTPADLETVISREYYFTANEGVNGMHLALRNYDHSIIHYKTKELMLLTFCVLVLKNGFTVTGESACASPENFDAELGRKIARENAKQKMWPLLGYALKERLSARI